MKTPRELVSKLAKIIEPPPRPPEPSVFKQSGGWGSDRPSAGGAPSHPLSPEESAAAKLAGAEALVQLQRQQDERPRGPILDQHIS